MHENANVRVVRKIYESLELGNVDSILKALHTDVVWRYPQMSGVPFAGNWRGREGVRDFFDSLARARELLEFRPERCIAQGDTVIALGRFLLRANSTGWDAASEWAHVWDLRNGEVARFTAYVDTAAVSRAHAGAA
jgi:ketosteroid isomerase-like protein